MSPDRIDVEVDGKHLSISNLDKVLYPKSGFTKGALIDYYTRISGVMLPHLRDRALTLRRYPNGVEEKSFFEKTAPKHRPDWLATTLVPRSENEHSWGKPRDAVPRENDIEYAVVNDRPSMVWAANLAAIEFHVPLWRAVGDAAPSPPDFLVFDLDPGPGTDIVQCCQVGLWIASEMASRGEAPCLPKTSGSKGLQLYSRLKANTSWAEARARALEIGQAVEKSHADLVVTNMRRELRKNKVLIDWSQNHPAKTTVAVYSLRATDAPTASTPITWDEVKSCIKSKDPTRLRFLVPEVLRRVEEHGDLFVELVASPKARRARNK